MNCFALKFCLLLSVSGVFTNAACPSSCSCDKDEGLYNQLGRRSIRQCTFTHLADGRDQGQILTCDFRKTQSDTALRITYQGDLRVVSSSNACRRWFFTINDNECASPATIETTVHPVGVTGLNNHRPATLDGFCENIPKGRVVVGLSIGKCKYGYENNPGDGYTCWGSVCRVIIEEVSPLL